MPCSVKILPFKIPEQQKTDISMEKLPVQMLKEVCIHITFRVHICTREKKNTAISCKEVNTSLQTTNKP